MFKRFVFVEGFTSLVNSGGNFSIDIFGTVKNHLGEEVAVTEDVEGHSIVNVVSWDGIRSYRIIDLVAIHFKDLQIPVTNYNDVVAFVIDGNKKNYRAENIGYRFKRKIELDGLPGFYYIPGFTRMCINKAGEFVNSTKKKLLKWNTMPPDPEKNIKGGYKRASYLMAGVPVSFSRHRALCLTFKDYPDNVDVLTVNHKNGIPGEDDLDNLEWATRSQNNTHAYVNDLKNQHMRVLSRDVFTGEVVEYYSISECARALGFATDESIRYRLYKTAFSSVFSDGKQFKLKDDKRDWVIPSDPKQAVSDARGKIQVIVRDCKTLEEKTFPSVTSAGAFTGVKGTSIDWRLNRNNKTPLFGFQFKYAEDREAFPNFTPDEHLDSLTPTAFQVECRNLLTGEEREYSSVKQASLGLGNKHIPAQLRDGKQPLLSDGWQVKYKDQAWIEVADFEQEIYKNTKEIVARDEKTGVCIIAASARQLAGILNKDHKALRVAAMTRGRKVYHGYRVRLGVSDDPWPTD